MCPSFEIFGRSIGMYGICALIGILLASGLAIYRCGKIGIWSENEILLIVFALLGVLIGGHLLYGITQIIRFILEFMRGDEIREILIFLSTSQIISILVFIVSIIFIFKKEKKN